MVAFRNFANAPNMASFVMKGIRGGRWIQFFSVLFKIFPQVESNIVITAIRINTQYNVDIIYIIFISLYVTKYGTEELIYGFM
jgi:hypothetical protein